MTPEREAELRKKADEIGDRVGYAFYRNPKDHPELAVAAFFALESLEAEVKKARREALEEAAKRCDHMMQFTDASGRVALSNAASDIRSLISKEEKPNDSFNIGFYIDSMGT